MKMAQLNWSAAFLAGALNVPLMAPAAAADGVPKDAFTAGSYRHMNFSAIRERTLGSAQTRLRE